VRTTWVTAPKVIGARDGWESTWQLLLKLGWLMDFGAIKKRLGAGGRHGANTLTRGDGVN
jgi:hypothetical protein